MNDKAFKYAFGMSFRANNTLIDLYFLTATSKFKATGADESVSIQESNGLQLDIGVDVLPARRIALYPYAGLSVRSETFTYETPIQINRNPANLTQIVVNNRSYSVNSGRLGVQAGAGLDLHLTDPATHRFSPIFFVKGGINRPVGSHRFRYEGQEVAPVPKTGIWELYGGIKLVYR